MTDRYVALDAIYDARWSCRAFKPDAVAEKAVSQIVRLAQKAPSWCNAQPWQITVTRGAETERFRSALKAEVASGAPKPDLDFPTTYSGAYQERRRTCGWQLYEAVGVQKGDRAGSARQMMRNYDLFDAPHVAILTSPAELGAYGAMDCGGFVTAFTTAAASLGVATIAQAAIAAYSPFVRTHFDLPDDRLVLCAISFGYPDLDHPSNGFRTERAALGDVIDWRG
ncbi:nitroreductase family protein [Thalassococcus sp. S3]|uniref:nitroreductase family protein n=1 Tax=Thalassococcus sp. S3 TaxID=2017482 RepID=UPI0010245F31|nr:nitroreductase family protein [Thalassococcus sp. S3]QBF31111.1 nitroreductase [Thalassococcus sp. S3]